MRDEKRLGLPRRRPFQPASGQIEVPRNTGVLDDRVVDDVATAKQLSETTGNAQMQPESIAIVNLRLLPDRYQGGSF